MANILGILGKIRFFLGKLTDVLIAGRQRGLWQEGQGGANPGYIPPEKPLDFTKRNR